MLRTKLLSQRALMCLKQSPWPPPTVIAPVIDGSAKIEEEKTPYYDPQSFYPIYLGEILDGRYQIAAKLGYGSNSTVWLARDLNRLRFSNEHYVAVKINAFSREARNIAENEQRNMQIITNSNPRHEGRNFVRTMLDSFHLVGSHGIHQCFVFEPLREPLWLLRTRFEGDTIPSSLLQVMLQMMLQGLDYLHSECQIVHTDLKPDNIMVRLEDSSILKREVEAEYADPLPQKSTGDRKIYLSRNNFGQPSTIPGIISITDFGHSTKGDIANYGCIQAEVYRAPEVILDAGWTYSADIWSLGVMLWDLLEGKVLFEEVDPLKNIYDDQTHLAYITSLIGTPPKKLLERGRRTSLFYNTDYSLKGNTTVPIRANLKDVIEKVDGENKIKFLDFLGRMLKWQPEERSTAKDLLKDPWLNIDSP